MRRWSLRTRLGVWHVTAITLLLAATALVVDHLLARAVERQLDGALLALAETEAASALDSPDDRVHLHPPPEGPAPASARRLDKLVQIVDADGQVVDRSATLGEAVLPIGPALLARLRRGETAIETIDDFGGEPVRLVSLPIESGGAFRYAVQVGALLGPARSVVRTARWVFLGGIAAALVAVALLGGLVTRAALRPIERLVATARRIGATDLGARLPHPGTADEIGQLAATLNDMLERIERSVEGQRRFTADASHELRSPLSRLRTELEITLRRPRTLSEHEAVLRSCLEEVERLAALAESLLTLARLDAGEVSKPSGTLVDTAVEDLLRRLAPEAARRAVTIVHDPAPGVRAPADAPALGLLLGNLLDNALKFTPAGGRVTIRCALEGEEVVLRVSDTGPGIPADELPHVFDRFFRSPSQSPSAPGVGLGLAICRAVVESQGGRLAAESPPGGGTTFVVRWPRPHDA